MRGTSTSGISPAHPPCTWRTIPSSTWIVSKTLVAPYSPRAAAGAPVSAPIDWEELDDPALRPGSFTIRDFPRRLTERGDPFRTVLTAGQVLPPIT
ncbi:MAG TPA: hypothetical protein VFB06_16460 [Streptosporangiaceae bacterium]|nr:hypothetical protein [Streptosporangiaceae bacterium]